MRYTVHELIELLKKIEDQSQKVCLSIDDGDTLHSLTLTGRIGGCFVLIHSDDLEKRLVMANESAEGTKKKRRKVYTQCLLKTPSRTRPGGKRGDA